MTNEDRLQGNKLDPEREKLIQEMLRDAEGRKTELPSELDREPVLHRGDADLPAPMVKSRVSSAGYVMVWDSRTYVKAPVLYYMLPQILRQRRLDGSYRWTTNDPGVLPQRGTFKCFLHREDPNRPHYDELGFRVCPKENITNPYQVTQHMKSKHRAEWAAIEEERRQKERLEDRQLQQFLLTKAFIEATEKPKKTAFVCDVCGADFGAQAILEKHKREQHS